MDATSYRTVAGTAAAEFKDRGSKFLAYVFPVDNIEDAKEKLAAVKKEHPKASHHCFAWRLGTDKNSFRSSDDGEPAGTAGKPILGQINSRQLTNVMVVVVRYFGGTLLGVPGLINAYRSASSAALDSAGIVIKPVLTTYALEFDYTLTNDVMRIIKSSDCLVLQKAMNLFCRMEIGIPVSRENDVLDKFKKLPLSSIQKAGTI
jgi:uncharacterized YigZ family protein